MEVEEVELDKEETLLSLDWLEEDDVDFFFPFFLETFFPFFFGALFFFDFFDLRFLSLPSSSESPSLSAAWKSCFVTVSVESSSPSFCQT